MITYSLGPILLRKTRLNKGIKKPPLRRSGKGIRYGDKPILRFYH